METIQLTAAEETSHLPVTRLHHVSYILTKEKKKTGQVCYTQI